MPVDGARDAMTRALTAAATPEEIAFCRYRLGELAFDHNRLDEAAQQVGGLLDVSKGWTLTIPAPNEASGAAARALALQQQSRAIAPTAPAVAASVATAAPVIASR